MELQAFSGPSDGRARSCLHAALWVGGILCTLAAAPAWAVDYYVAKNGSDTNPGTEAAPWLTIGKAANSLHAGDTVYVKGGTYHEKVTLRVQGNATYGYITFRNYNNDVVIVDGTGFNLSSDWAGIIEAVAKSYVRIQGFHVQNAQHGISIFVSGGTSGASHVQIVNNEVSNHNGNNAIICQGDHLTDVLIDSNDVHDCVTHNYEAIRIDGDTRNFIISNNQVHDNSNIGIDIVGWTAQPAYGWIRNNICWGNGLSAGGAHGIYVDGGTYVTIEDNICYANWGGISVGAEAPGKVARHIIVRRNLVYDNLSRGINLGSCQSCGRPQDCAVVHNVSYNNNVQDGSSAMTVNYFQGDNLIQNNILVQAPGANPYYYIFFYTADNSAGHVTIDYNCEYPDTAEFYYQWLRYRSFSEWQAASGQDGHAFVANPVFVSSATQDFRLQAGSPCIDTGDFLARATTSGSGTVLAVDDASSFTDGYAGLFPGDVIRVGNQAPVTLSQVDYATAQLTLSQPLDWTANDGVALVYLGSRPDIGAYEYGLTTTAGVLSGAVSDLDTGRTLAGASLISGSLSAVSDATGGYTLTLPAGDHRLTCTLTGYQPQEKLVGVLSGETVLLNWRLQSTTPRSTDFTVSPRIYVRGRSPEERIRFGNLPPEATIRLFAVSGRVVTTLHHQAPFGLGSEDWDISGMASGIYLYHIQTAQQQKRGKIVIIK